MQKLNILILTLIILVQSQYQIPSYYGFWSKRFYQPKIILEGQFSVFEMHFGIDLSYDGTVVYFADEDEHCVWEYNIKTQSYKVLAGKCSMSGNRTGNSQNALFNGPSSIAYFMPDPLRSLNASKSTIHLTTNQTCPLEDPQCILTDIQLQTLQTSLSLQNIRIKPVINLYSINPQLGSQYIFITDKLNHCIKRITLQTKYTEVVAGFCGQAGFLDGPLGFNRLNKPSNIGVDAQGVVYFFDQGNEYMRKLTLDKGIETLLNGACTQYRRSNEKNRFVKGFQLKKMICYSNWIEKKTGSSVQHYFNEDLLNICTLHSSKCPS